MRFVSVRELRGKSAAIWKELAQEQEMVITSNGKPIAVLSATSEELLEELLAALRSTRALAAVNAMQQASIKAGTDRLSAADIEAAVKAVRKGLLLLMGSEPEEFEREARFLLALKLFELRRISAGKAAEMSGMQKSEFLLKASQLNVAVVDLDQDQLDAEFKNA